MKNLTSFLIALILMICNNTLFAQTDTLTILHVNDTHSCLAPLGPRGENLQGTKGGIARAASLIGLNKLTEPNVITLHAGDIFIGDLFFNVFFGAAELQIMNAIGFDAINLGNHEFDLEPSTLEAAFQNSFTPEEGFPILSANCLVPADTLQTLQSYMKPFIIKEMGNLKVGIFGLTTPETNFLSFPSPVVFDTNIVQIADEMIDSLSSKGCNVIICLSHLGFDLDKTLASYLPNIDVIIGAHDHYKLEEPHKVISATNKETYIVQASAFYSHIGKLKLSVVNNVISFLSYELIPLESPIPEEPSVKAIVDNLITDIENTYGPLYTQQIANAEVDFDEVANPSTGFSDTPIGNLVTDAFRAKTGTDIAIEPGGSTSQPIYAGPIVAADIFRAIGYGFNLVDGLGYRLATFKMTGLEILTGLEFGLASVEKNDEFLIQVSGMDYGFEISKPPYQRLTFTTVNDIPIDPAAIYSITANEFVLGFLQLFLGIEPTDIVLLEDLTEFKVVSEYIAAKGTITPQSGDRITGIKEKKIKTSLPSNYKLNQNYPNPFNPSTKIEFAIPQNVYTELKIFNTIGEEVATLVSNYLKSGTYEYEWDASNLPSGIYFYKINAGKFTEIKKAILLK